MRGHCIRLGESRAFYLLSYCAHVLTTVAWLRLYRHPYLYTVELPKALSINGTINLVVETVQTHAAYPWPQQASQKDDQKFKYDTELFVLSPYKTATQRTKIRCVRSKLTLL